MNNLKLYITEKLHLNKSISIYSCRPKDRDQLRKILENRLAEDKDADLNDIDVSGITDMSLDQKTNKGLFEDLDPHNIDISEWDVSNVKTMIGMFYDCLNFNCDLSNWDVSNVRNMDSMFYECKNFNCDISNWDVSNVEDMRYMFYNCLLFDCDLSSWNVNNIELMSCMFNGCTSLKNKPSWYKE